MITLEDAVVDILQGTCEGVEDVPNEGLGDKLLLFLLFLLLLLFLRVPFVMGEIPHDEVLNGAKLTVFGEETHLIEKTTFCDEGIHKANNIWVVENLEKENLASQLFIICGDFLQNAALSRIFIFDKVDAFVLSTLATTLAWIQCFFDCVEMLGRFFRYLNTASRQPVNCAKTPLVIHF